uniref:Transmembrane protein n=1 Tax=viral metagenome TaxID=1070528 RepID=A0A6C0CQJ2_9ZZZZ
MSDNSPTLFKKTHITPNQIMSNNQETAKRNNEDCSLCVFILLKTLIVIGLVTWEIFAIIALVNNSNEDIQEQCSTSNLWAALLSTCIVTGINMLFNRKTDEENQGPFGKMVGCLGLGIFIWLCVEIFNDCAMNNLMNNQVHILSYIYFWIIVGLLALILAIAILFMCGSCFAACCCDKKEETKDPLDLI